MKSTNIRKKLIGFSFLATTLFFTTTAVQAQDDTQPRFGIKGGINLSNLRVDDVDDENTKFALHGGIWAKIPAGELFAVQPELLYTRTGAEIAGYSGLGNTGQINFNLDYIQLPVLASFTLGPVSIQAGPYVSYLLGANVKNIRVDENGVPTDNDNAETIDLDRDDFNGIDYGLAGGLAIDIKGFQLGARYNYGLREIASGGLSGEIADNAKNSVAQVYVAFGF